MSKRNDRGQFAKSHPRWVLALSWIGSLLSVALLFVTSSALLGTLGSFRSCNSNSAGLFIHGCGKDGLTLGDVIIFGLFIACAALTLSTVTAAWRLTRKGV